VPPARAENRVLSARHARSWPARLASTLATTPTPYWPPLPQLHIGRPLEAIVEERLGKIQHNINRVLRLKEMDLNESIRRLDKVFLHSKYIGNYIHHCTVNFYENLVHRVNAEFNKKIAKVSKVIGSVTEDATRINRIIYEANYLVSNKRHIDLFDNYDRLLKQSEYMYFKKHEGKPGLTLRPDPGQGGIRGPSGQPSLMIKQSRRISTEMKKHIIFLNNLHYPLCHRRLEAQQLVQIEISPGILKSMANELS
jgi:hypothetical protein